jgi:hypothetical protein
MQAVLALTLQKKAAEEKATKSQKQRPTTTTAMNHTM